MSTFGPASTFDLERTRAEANATAQGELKRGAILAGKYRLEMLLGQGGMACVWSAYHLELELPVAIKLLHASAQSQRLAQRLRLEARAAARLVHPSIVRILDVGVTDSGAPFIVMELLTGESLADLLARGRLSAVRAVQLLLPIAAGLEAAHGHGVVHRDLKPGNVFISSEGQHLQPKLVDFGIAKLVHDLRSRITEKGVLLGSPHYMSPEQARGDDIDARSDVWSFCVLLYRAVTGTLPFKGDDERATLDAILHDAPAQSPLSEIDPELALLIGWGLEKEASQRPQAIHELAERLADWLLAQGISEDACGALSLSRRLAKPAPARPDPDCTQPSQRRVRAQEAVTRRLAPAARAWRLPALALALLVAASLAWLDWRPAAEARASAPSTAALPTAPVRAARAAPPILADAQRPAPEQADSEPTVEPPTSVASKPPRPAPRTRPATSSRLPF